MFRTILSFITASEILTPPTLLPAQLDITDENHLHTVMNAVGEKQFKKLTLMSSGMTLHGSVRSLFLDAKSNIFGTSSSKLSLNVPLAASLSTVENQQEPE